LSKYKKYLSAILVMCLLVGCTAKPTVIESGAAPSSQKTAESEMQGAQEYLFEAQGMDSIQLTGQEILDGKEVDMSVKIADGIDVDFHISRDTPNGTKLYATYKSQAVNLAVNYISPDVFDNDEAITTYIYQIACYDFNKDDQKEVVVAAGNNDDQLSIFIFGVDVESQFIYNPENYILGYKNAYTNEDNEICVPSPSGVKNYKYNMKAQDPEYAKVSGPIKIVADYATQEQLEKYKAAETYTKDEGANSLLILPTETLKDVTVYSIEYDADTDQYNISNALYNIPEITPDAPLILQAFLPDFPSLAVSYTSEAGVEQLCGISESLEDGTIYLFEMGIPKG